MNILLDTNTFIASGFNPKSSSAKILRAVEKGTVNLVWNEATRRETQRMISKIPKLSWDTFSGLFRDESEYKDDINTNDYQFIEDPDDRKYAALGEATGSIIVTNDKHLLTQRRRLGTPVMTPHEFTNSYADLI